MIGNTTLTVTLFLILTSPLAYAEDEADEAIEVESERVCILTRNVEDFDALSDKYIVVEERRNKFFLLTMDRSCSGLRNAHTIGFKTTTARICSERAGNEIVYSDLGSPRTCRIDTIVPVENKDDARAIVEEEEQHDKHKQKDKNKD